ncbi:aspartic peptidase domain-containing protein [Abortiporus biennis]|nr:aspartic peptidase domain-containing protein [Abortiporus biennis]
MNALFVFVLISLCGISNALVIPVESRSAHRHALEASEGQGFGQDSLGHGHLHGSLAQGGHHKDRHPRHHRHAHGHKHEQEDDMFQGTGVPMWSNKISTDIKNARDVVYATNITLGGQQMLIQLDTGSSDVWVMPPAPIQTTNTTTLTTNLTFGIGHVEGTIQFADMALGPYEVRSQAFLNATKADNFGAIFSNNISGILGLAFDQGSDVNVQTLLNFGKGTTQGRTFLSNVFNQDKNAPNFFTVLLGRTDDPSSDEEGIFTISEYNDGFEDIEDQPKLLRTPAQLGDTLPRWSIQMDGLSINGEDFEFEESSVPESEDGSPVVVLDTGFTFSQIPQAAVDAIYQSIDGSVFNETTGLYDVPCTSTADIEFSFGGQSYPIHPLDLTVVKNVDGRIVCQNTFRPIKLPPGTSAGFDMILGVNFLKNVYASFDFGDWTPSEKDNGVPYIQLLSVTDSEKAINDFINVRPGQLQAAANPGEQTAAPTGILSGQKHGSGKVGGSTDPSAAIPSAPTSVAAGGVATASDASTATPPVALPGGPEPAAASAVTGTATPAFTIPGTPLGVTSVGAVPTGSPASAPTGTEVSLPGTPLSVSVEVNPAASSSSPATPPTGTGAAIATPSGTPSAPTESSAAVPTAATLSSVEASSTPAVAAPPVALTGAPSVAAPSGSTPTEIASGSAGVPAALPSSSGSSAVGPTDAASTSTPAAASAGVPSAVVSTPTDTATPSGASPTVSDASAATSAGTAAPTSDATASPSAPTSAGTESPTSSGAAPTSTDSSTPAVAAVAPTDATAASSAASSAPTESAAVAGSLSTPDSSSSSGYPAAPIAGQTQNVGKRSVMFLKPVHRFPIFPRPVHRCATAVLASYGPAILAILSGILFLSLVSTIVGIIIVVRIWSRNRASSEAEYEELVQDGNGAIFIKDEEEEVYRA